VTFSLLADESTWRRNLLSIERKKCTIRYRSIDDSICSDCDIFVSNKHNINRNSLTFIGIHYRDHVSASAAAFEYIFMGEVSFTVKEIEVFVLTD
jgi:hypothetical protein